MKIYTRTGDDGTTALFSGRRVPKHHLRVEAYGTVDELNSVLGLARALGPHPQTDAWLERVQHQLFNLGADLATPMDAQNSRIVRMDADTVHWVEGLIDAMDADLPQLRTFILPGGAPVVAQIHVARTVCRRAERVTVMLAEVEALGEHVLPYLNRLSDWLFTLARWENLQAGNIEQPWSPDV